MKKFLSLAVLALICCGCECFLPPGEAPEGRILENVQQDGMAEIRDLRRAEDYFINELIRETLMHAPGEAVKIAADKKSRAAAEYIVLKAGEISGIRAVTDSTAKFTLNSTCCRKSWSLQLYSGSDMIWQSTVRLN